MTVAVSLNLSDGVILGVDSAVTILTPDGTGIAKVYDQAQKLFQLTSCPIGLAFYGAGGIGVRSMGSYVREFEVTDPSGVLRGQAGLSDAVEAFRSFLCQKYQETIVPAVEHATGKSFDQIPDAQRPTVGVVAAGFSGNAHLSEVWNIMLPAHASPGSAACKRQQGDFGDDWYALDQPIIRYLNGFDSTMVYTLLTEFEKILGRSLSEQEMQTLEQIVTSVGYQIPFGGMPMEEGVEYVRFLVNLVINHYRFTVGAPVVGGAVHIGLVTCRGDNFQILQEDA
ncbi:MAG TPA: hypothetical protein VFB58_17590 [Chloroflexota bacterium]|nr:hypothetical protein [Chloroflexota bacterium]